MDSDKHKKSILRPHCDVEVTPSNTFKDNNSQLEGTPTVVIALQEPKVIKFFKRYSDGNKFQNAGKYIDEMEMSHGDIFYLHLKDERVERREVHNGDEKLIEKLSSQFKHGVECNIEKQINNHMDTRIYRKVSISVCFCQTNKKHCYCTKNHTVIDKDGNVVGNNKSTMKM